MAKIPLLLARHTLCCCVPEYLPTWRQATHTHRLLPSPRTQGANRPSARAITLALLNKPYFKATAVTNSSALASALGQLICECRPAHT